MKKDEAFDILETIAAAYPSFELNEKRVEVWIETLESMSYDRVKKRLKKHILEKPFPPAIAEIAAYDNPKNDFLEKQKEWEKEAEERIKREKEEGYVRPKPPWEQ